MQETVASSGPFPFFGDGPSAGDDIFVVKTKLECSPTHLTPIDGHLLQILGDNDLTLDIFGMADPNEIRALVDGGTGFDTAHHTANVLVRNCEA